MPETAGCVQVGACRGDMTDHDRVIKALATVPEKHLLIVDLAGELTTEKGTLDYELVNERMPDINMAVAEARAYARATANAINALKNIPARGQVRDNVTGLDLLEEMVLNDDV